MRILIVLAILGSALAVPTNPGRIVGGEDTTVERYPFMVNMNYNFWGIWWLQACGGSLITERTVLTAAHCIEGDHPRDWRMITGSSFTSGQGGNINQVFQLIIHPEYEKASPLDADVALVILTDRAILGDRVQTIAIASQTSHLGTGYAVTAIGFGTVRYQGPSPTVLQHVDMSVVDQEFCKERYAFLKTRPGFALWPDVTDNMVCTADTVVGGKDACQGDSGGPIIYKEVSFDILVAVTSWGYECAHPEYPGVLARVSPFADWIQKNSL